jgi:cytoskeletal protein CcmA (bactofilin family)
MDNKPNLPVMDGSLNDSLETESSGVVVQNTPIQSDPGSPFSSPEQTSTPIQNKRPLLQRAAQKMNIYFILFLLVIMMAGGVIDYAYLSNKQGSATPSISSRSVSPSTFSQLANSDSTVGSTNQVLTIQSSAVFAGKVLARQGLEVAGNLQVGGTLGINDLAIAGSAGIQGSLSLAKNLQVAGNGTFGGALSASQITATNLILNGDLTISHHLLTNGGLPSKVDGNALGSGGTSSVTGNDIGGAITINTGNGPAIGCFLSINFTTTYATTPKIILTPVGKSAGGLSYYVSRTTSGFSVCDSATPPANTSFGFDYFTFN